jgi:hypothetical protein
VEEVGVLHLLPCLEEAAVVDEAAEVAEEK